MRQGREHTVEVTCVYQNFELTSQAKTDKIVADSIFSYRFNYLQSLKICIDILENEVLDKDPICGLRSHHFVKSFLEGSLRNKVPV